MKFKFYNPKEEREGIDFSVDDDVVLKVNGREIIHDWDANATTFGPRGEEKNPTFRAAYPLIIHIKCRNSYAGGAFGPLRVKNLTTDKDYPVIGAKSTDEEWTIFVNTRVIVTPLGTWPAPALNLIAGLLEGGLLKPRVEVLEG